MPTPSTPSTEQPKAQTPGRKMGCLKVVALVAIATLILLFVFRGPLLRGPVLKAGVWAAERYAGLEMRAAGLETNGWSFLRVDGLEAEALAADNVLRKLGAASVDVRFSLPALLRGNLQGLKSVEVQGLDVEVDLSVASDVESPPPNPLPEHLPALKVNGLRLALVPSEGRAVTVMGETLAVEPGANGETLSFLLPRVEIEAPETKPTAFPASGRLLYRGGLISVESLETGPVRFSADSFVDLTALAEERITARLEASSPSGGGSAEGSLDHGVVDAALRFDDFELASLTQLLAEPSLEDLSGTLDLEGQVIVPLDDALGGSGSLEARLASPAMAGRRFDQAKVEGSWQENVLAIDQLDIEQGANQVQLTARDLPLKDIDFETWLDRATGNLQVQLKDLPSLLATEGVEMPEEMPAKIPDHQLSLQGNLENGSLELLGGALTVADGSLKVERGRLGLATRRDAETGEEQVALELDLGLQANFPDLSPVGAVLGTPGAWSGSLRGDIQVAGILPELSGEANLEGENLVASGARLGRFRLDAVAEETKIRFRTLHIEAPWGNLDAGGGVSLADRRLEALTIDAEVNDAALLATEAADFPKVVGSFRMTARLAGPLDRLHGELELRGTGGPAEGPIFDVIEVDGQAADGLWQLQRLFAEGNLGRFEAAGELQTVRGEAPLDGAKGRITELRWQREGEELSLQQPTDFELTGPILEARGLELRGTVGGITADVRTDRGETTLRAVLEEVEPEAFVGYLLPEGLSLGGLSGTVDLVSGAAGLRLETSGHLDRLQSDKIGDVLSLDWRGRLQDNRLFMEELVAKRGQEEILEIHGEAPLAPLGPELLPSGVVRFEGTVSPFRLEDIALGSPDTLVSAQLDGDFTLAGEWASLEGDLRFRGRDMNLDLAQAPSVLRDGEATAQIHLGTRGEGLRLEKLNVNFPERLTAEASGFVPWDGDVVTLMTDGVSLMSAPLDLQVDMRLEDVRWLRPLLPDVRRLEGTAWADVRIAGTMENPRPEGALHLEGVALRLEEGGFSLEELAGRIDVQERRLELADVAGKLGAEPFQLTGSVDLEEGGAGVDLGLKGKNLLLLRDPSLRLRSDVDVRVAGPMDALVISGSLGLRNSRLTQEIDLLGLAAGSVTSTLAGSGPPSVDTGGLQLFSFPDPPLAQARLNLSVTTVDPLTLASNLATGSLRLDLRIRGTGEVPLPQGLVYLEPTQVRLPSGTVQFDSGTVRFREENPFSPSLALNGSARLRGYDIDIGVTGSLNQPEVVLSSSPPLPNDELLLLLLTGQLPASGSSSGLKDRQAAEAVVLYLARDFLTRWLSKGGDPSDASWVSRFEIVRGRDVSENGVETTEASFRVAGEDRLSGDLRTLYLVAEQDSFEDYNYGLRFVFRFK